MGGSSGGGTNTVEQESQPPAQYLQAYSAANTAAQQDASVPYQSYQGQVVAQLAPDQTAGIGQVEDLTANGGVQAPYLQAAQNDFNSATQPLLTPQLQSDIAANSGQALVPATSAAVSGIQGAANTATGGIQNATGAATTGIQGATSAGTTGIQGATTAGTQGIQNATGQSAMGIAGATGQGVQGINSATGEGASGITAAAGTGASGITNAAAGLTPSSLNQWEDPYTSQVVQATQNEFNNQNAQQQTQVAGNAISNGAFGGDRAAVASALTAQQEQLAQAPVIAGLENTGYTTALGAAQNQAALQTQAATSAGSLGLQGATSAGSLEEQGANSAASLGLQGATSVGSTLQQGANSSASLGLQGASTSGALGVQGASTAGSLGLQGESTAGTLGLQGATAAGQAGMTGATTESQLGLQGSQESLGANEANAWLGSQAAFGEANLGSEAQSTGLTGASALLSSGALEQGQAQENLNIPYEQYTAAQAYPFQTTGWEANIAEGLGGSSGGTSSTTSPAASVASQVGGLATAGVGTLGVTGAFGNSGYLTGANGLFGSGAGAAGIDNGVFDTGAAAATDAAGSAAIDDGVFDLAAAAVKRGGGITGRATGGMIPSGIPRRDSGGATPADTVTVQSSDQSSPGQSNPSASWYAPLIQENLDSQMAASLAPAVAADSSGMRSGGMVPRRAAGGPMSSSDTPWFAKDEERQSTERHGLLTSPVGGRTDHLAVSPATGSYVIPADVISGLGEGNTLAGANVMQKILETGPHGTPMPSGRRGSGPPRPPPAYREGEGDDGMASGGGIPHYAAGGMSPAVSSYLAGNGLGGSGLPSGNGVYSAVPSTGINASTGQGTSNTGLPALDAYLNNTEKGTTFAPQVAAAPPAAPAQSPPVSAQSAQDTLAAQQAAAALNNPNATAGGGQMRSGGMIQRRADGGPAQDDADGDAEVEAALDRARGMRPPGGPHMSLGYTPPTMSGMAGPPGMPSGDGPQITAPQTDDSSSAPAPNRMLHPKSDIVVKGGMQPTSGPSAPPAGLSSTPPPQHQDPSSRHSDADAYLSKLQPSKPDPWLDLALAGFATAAGKSPHALENIGAGGEKGMLAYAQQKQEASKEGLQAGETAARLADTAAYREGTTDWRNRGLEIKQAANTAMDQVRQRANDLKASGLTIDAGFKQAQEEYMTGKLGISQQNADTATTNSNTRTNLGYAGLAQKQQAQDALDKYRQSVQQRLDHGMSLKDAHEQAWQENQKLLQSSHATEQDIQLAKAFNPITGKAAFSDPHATGQALRDKNAQPATPVPPPAAAKPDVSSLWGN